MERDPQLPFSLKKIPFRYAEEPPPLEKQTTSMERTLSTLKKTIEEVRQATLERTLNLPASTDTLTPTLIEKIYKEALQGLTLESIAALVGVDPDTLNQWVAAGETLVKSKKAWETEEETLQVTLFKALRVASANLEKKALQAVHGAISQKNLQAATWILKERTAGWQPAGAPSRTPSQFACNRQPPPGSEQPFWLTSGSLPMTARRIPFRSFLTHLGVTPEGGQNVLVDLLDGVDPMDMPSTYRDLALELTGGVERIPPSARSILVLVAGGRSGKTYLLSLYTLYSALTLPIDHLAPGEVAFAALIAPTLDLAEQNLNYIAGAIRSDSVLSSLVIGDTARSISILQRPGGRPVQIRPFAASRGGVTGRGKSLVGAILSETCFFRDVSTGIVNDEDIFRAVSPRVISGGLTVVETTPWVASGLVYDFYKKNWGHPTTCMVMHAPTRKMRVDPHILTIVDREYERDPDNAMVEYGAEWKTHTSGGLFSQDEMEVLVPKSPSPPSLSPGDRVVAAIDLGFVRNSAVLCVLSANPMGELRVIHLEELQPKAEPLVPSQVCQHFAETLRRYKCSLVGADGHYLETLREYIAPMGIAILPSGGAAADRFLALRTALRERRVSVCSRNLHESICVNSIPHDQLFPRLRRQLLGVKQKPTPGGSLSIHLPLGSDGSHGDLIDCLARAVYTYSHHGGSTVKKEVENAYAPLERELEKQISRFEKIWW